MSIRIRAALARDIDGMLALETLFPSDPLSRVALRRFLRVPSARIWVAVSGQQICGDVLMLLRRGSDCCRIYSLVVSPEARGQGLGVRLMVCAERGARAAGCLRMRLEVRTDNRAALQLYQKRGYQTVATLPRYYEDGADGLRLEKILR